MSAMGYYLFCHKLEIRDLADSGYGVLAGPHMFAWSFPGVTCGEA
jgi:hypothetical protein